MNSDHNILNDDLSNVSTSMPLLTEGLYDLTIKDVKIEKTKDQTGEMLAISLATTAPATAQGTGEPLAPGFPIFDRIMITPTEKLSVESIKRRVAAFTQAVGVRSVMPLEQFAGKVVRAKIVVDPERTDKTTGRTYEARNAVKTYVLP